MAVEWLPISAKNLLASWTQNGTKNNDATQQQWSNQEQAYTHNHERSCSWRFHAD
ncbi:MAG: hypothetical protein PCFJNLEI_00160 [Verrucomicrobiae bacterium]|nr:hypothetical protein [Verrucomicrobiae bacterium]